MIWLGSTPILKEAVMGHQPHEKTCGSTAIQRTPMPQGHYTFINILAFSGIRTQALHPTCQCHEPLYRVVTKLFYQVIYSQFGLAIHQNDHQARRRFVEWAQNEIAVVPDFHKRILLSDEAPFWLNGYVNKQNRRIWSEANPQVYVETPLHTEKLTVWCALWAGGIIGPYFFKSDEGHNVTVNGDRTATARSDVVQSGRPIFDEFFQHLWPYIGNNTANVVFRMVKRLRLIRIDQ
ncbi:DUF4817 domain-containing protein [Trichonephila clavipes]|nr:DUF4817 domain-containing protein [Trichonephila clavipes]